jgi:hypothetical protein
VKTKFHNTVVCSLLHAPSHNMPTSGVAPIGSVVFLCDFCFFRHFLLVSRADALERIEKGLKRKSKLFFLEFIMNR